MIRDPLITAARIAIIAARALLWFAGLVMAGLFVATLFASDAQLAEWGREAAELGGAAESRPALAILFGFMLLIIVPAERFFQQLQAIVDTVPKGNPFDPANADRLRRMAWLAVAFQTVSLGVNLLSDRTKEMSDRLDMTLELSFEGIFLALLLFVLARVFRLGAAMREDLEGTV